MPSRKGKLIVFYGINNLGKSTQAHLLVEKLQNLNHPSEYLKYPLYDLEPSGPLINDYLRNNNPHNLSAREAQILYTLNRYHYQEELLKKLNSGINIIAEDYIGTGLAWGWGAGVDLEFLEKINQNLISEDLAILFDGERFTEAIEKNHKHENDHDFSQKVRQNHLVLGEKYKWEKINANLSIDKIREIIWEKIERLLNL